MGQRNEESKLGNDLDFDYNTTGENVLRDSFSHSLPIRSVTNVFNETVNQTGLDQVVNTNMTGSHCWDQEGGFHIVCIFVLGVGVICSILTLFCAYKIYRLATGITGSEPSSTSSSQKMVNSRNDSQASTKTRQSSHSLMLNSDRIDTVQMDTVVVHNKVEERADIVTNNCLC